MRRIALFITCFNDTIPLVERFSRTFAEYDAVVTPSASWTGTVWPTCCRPRTTACARSDGRSPN
ncbi:hypothetical protein ACWC4A_53060 [Streptomyces mirabilis]|uniref:hypothetical protein n=1 Tax=Streptomyces mirabilis TaxID=68239 RepID=UPI00365314FC